MPRSRTHSGKSLSFHTYTVLGDDIFTLHQEVKEYGGRIISISQLPNVLVYNSSKSIDTSHRYYRVHISYHEPGAKTASAVGDAMVREMYAFGWSPAHIEQRLLYDYGYDVHKREFMFE